jgi:hypothetical protein
LKINNYIFVKYYDGGGAFKLKRTKLIRNNVEAEFNEELCGVETVIVYSLPLIFKLIMLHISMAKIKAAKFKSMVSHHVTRRRAFSW